MRSPTFLLLGTIMALPSTITANWWWESSTTDADNWGHTEKSWGWDTTPCTTKTPAKETTKEITTPCTTTPAKETETETKTFTKCTECNPVPTTTVPLPISVGTTIVVSETKSSIAYTSVAPTSVLATTPILTTPASVQLTTTLSTKTTAVGTTSTTGAAPSTFTGGATKGQVAWGVGVGLGSLGMAIALF